MCLKRESGAGRGLVHEPALVFQMPHGNSTFEDNIVNSVNLGMHEVPLLLAGVINT